MIFGIGTDIVEIKRIEEITSLKKFAGRILSENEQHIFASMNDSKKIRYISKQFAGKEAISKALGTGINKDVSFNNIEILRDDDGMPFFNPINQLDNLIADLGITKTHVSLADENHYAIAIAVLEK
jgi:holo-[acyl-carrier protein] synthase|tara:strand:+ start:574 stop:951 length:378 start_codon:yes stop_codon:yes gene_type:complete